MVGKERQKQRLNAALAEARQREREQRPREVWREVLDHGEARPAAKITEADSNVAAMPYRSPVREQARAALDAIEHRAIVPHAETVEEQEEAFARSEEPRERHELNPE